MKSIFLLLTILSVTFSACKKDDIVEDDDIIVSEDNVDDVLLSGTWYIANATRSSGADVTANYSGYTLNFEPANALSLRKGGETELVGWQAGSGSSGVKIEFEIPFTLADEIQDLDEKWYVTRLTRTRLTMQEENNSTQTITFRKN